MNGARVVRGGLRFGRRLVRGRRGPRRQIPSDVHIAQFFAELDARGIDYCVLRWFESLPETEAGEDIDLLVADDDVDRLMEFFGPQRLPRRGQDVDVYSVSGLQGTDHQHVAYYPPHLAAEILGSAVTLDERYRVPNAQMHFRSLAYHAVIRKGPAAGIPLDGSHDIAVRSDHEYAGTLGRLAEADGFEGPPTLEGYADHLQSRNWLPELETIDRFRDARPWLDSLFPREEQVGDNDVELIAFILRARTVELGLADTVTAEIQRSGVEIVLDIELTGEQREAARSRLRGGVWHQGPHPCSGGGPARLVVGVDPFAAIREGDPLSRTAKERARRVVWQAVPRAERFNPVHSTDTSKQAQEYLDMIVPVQADALLATARSLAVDPPVIDDIEHVPTKLRRAAVWRGRLGGERVVVKIYRPSAQTYLQRELIAHERLGDRSEVPELDSHGEGWIARRELPSDEFEPIEGRLPLEALRGLVDLAAAANRRGVVVLDIHPGNLLFSQRRGVRLLDFEFCFEDQPVERWLHRSPTVRGIDRSWHDDAPNGALRSRASSASAFRFRNTGVPLRVGVYGSPRLQAGTRLILSPAWYVSRTLRRAPMWLVDHSPAIRRFVQTVRAL